MLVVNVNGVIIGLLQSTMNGVLVAPEARPVGEATMYAFVPALVFDRPARSKLRHRIDSYGVAPDSGIR